MLHLRCLMSKFPEILILLCRKICSVFIRFFTKLFPIAVVLLLNKNLIFFFFKNLISSSSTLSWYSRKHFYSILTNLSNLSHTKSSAVPFAKFRSDLKNVLNQNTFQQCKRSLMFKIGLLINFLIFARKYLCSSYFLISYMPDGLQLY